MRSSFAALWRREEGVATVEYALLLALVVAASVLAWQGLSDTIGNMLGECTAQISNAGN